MAYHLYGSVSLMSEAPRPHHHSQSATIRTAAKARLSCVIPALDESDNLSMLLPEVQDLLSGLSDDWEILVVDDGSTDGTEALMSDWCRHPGFRYLQLSRNFGKEAALTAGLEAVTGDLILQLDADRQHPLELVPAMIERWEQGVDMVYGVREDRSDESFSKRAFTRLFYLLIHGGREFQVPVNAGDFRVMDRAVADALLRLPERTRFMKGLYAWVGFSSQPMPYVPRQRTAGDSRFDGWRLTRLALHGVLSFSNWPLRLVSLSGFLVSLCSFLYGAFIVFDFLLNGNRVDGWPTIVTILLFFSGINLLSLGILGEYIGKIFEEVKARPVYLVRQQRGASSRAERP